MNCHQAQTAIGAEPGTRDPDVLAHVEQCEQCSAYRREMQDMDRLIQRALAVPVDPSISSTPAAPKTSKPGWRRSYFRSWQIAASLLVSLMIGATIWVASTRESLAEQIVEHTDHESFSIVRTDERADSQVLDSVLGRAGLSLRPDALHVSYASSCLFHGDRVPHLVVQTEQGPVTVIVLPNEPATKKAQRFNGNGYEGVILPAPRGVLAVLGKDVPVEEVVDKVLGAVEYK